MTTETIKPEKLGDVDKNVWLLLQDSEKRYGIQYLAKPTGETIIRKDGITFQLPIELPKQGEEAFTDGNLTVRMKFVSGHIHYNIDDLKAAGFINGNQ